MRNYLQFKKRTVLILLVVLFSCNLFAQNSNGKKIVYVLDVNKINPTTGEHVEEPIMKFFSDNGYTVHRFPTMNLSNATQEQLDSLDNADLVYLGRSVPSSNLQQDDQRAKWNAIKAPVLTGNQWGLRSNRSKWFASEKIGANHDQFAVVEALIEKEDPVFGDLKGIVKFWEGPCNILDISEATSATNGTIMAANYSDPIGVLFVRFQPYVEFYEGSNEMPVAERVFMGCASDQAKDPDGNVIYSYFGFSPEFKQVFLNEAGRLTGIFPKVNSVDEKIDNLKVQVYPNPVQDRLTVEMNDLTAVQIFDLSGRTIVSLDASQNRISFQVDNLNRGIYLLKAIDADGNSITRKITKE